MIDTVIFDLGGVLVDFHPFEGMEKLGFSEDALKSFADNIYGSGFWEDCDRVPYTEEQIRAEYKKRLPGYEKEVDLFWDNLTVVTGVRDYAHKWLKELKDRGLKLYVLSNYGKASFEINSKIYDFLPMMDGMVVSYEYEKVKPEAELYEILLDKYDINRENAVFIDDRMINVEGAINVGLKAIIFDDYDSTKRRLEELL